MIGADRLRTTNAQWDALPVVISLALTTLFLHDASVKSLEELLDPERGKNSPHPFYFDDQKERADMIEFLKGLDNNSEKSKADKKVLKK